MAKRPASRNRAGAGRAIAVPTKGESESIRIRPISNGFIISRSGVKRNKYFEHEEFSPTKPVITATAPAKGKR
jgi:hypothetical protein